MKYSIGLQRESAVSAGCRLIDILKPLGGPDRRMHMRKTRDHVFTLCGEGIKQATTWISVVNDPNSATCLACLREAAS